MKIQADFSTISHEYTPLPAGDYQAVVEEVEEGEKNNKPQVHFTFKINDPSKPEFADREVHDFLILIKNDGKPNKISLGRIKAVALAVLGETAANSNDGIDPQELKGGTVMLTLEEGTFTKENEDGTKTTKKRTEIAKISKV